MSLSQVPAPAAGREAQRRRTRRAIVAAARRLAEDGISAPTVDAIASEAEVSRRTVYMHFPTLDQLMLDVALGALSEAYVGSALESPSAATGEDAAARVEALVDAMHDLAPTTLPLGRRIIRLTVDRSSEAPEWRRGQRRVTWIETALEPIRDRLGPEPFDRLVSGLAVLIGFESMVVLGDVCGLAPPAQLEVTRWAARALVEAALAEALQG